MKSEDIDCKPVQKSDLKIKYHNCVICGKSFTNFGLGGHMSRAHKGESIAFKEKRQKRELRTYHRDLLRRAQKKYREMFGTHIQNKNMRRKNLEIIKNELRHMDSL